VQKPNPRQYQAKMPALPELGILFQRPGDIVVSVRQGSVDFGITGIDVLEEKRGDNGDIIVLHDALGYSAVRSCSPSLKRGRMSPTSHR
jgi:ATP phosphoribosyltransferase